MVDSIDEKIKAYSRVPRLQAYDISATFGDGQPGCIEKRVVDESGEYHLDTQAWEAGEVAYQCLKQLYPKGITAIEFTNVAKEFYSMACNDIYPNILNLAESGELDIRPNGVEGMKAAWADYDWCRRVMFVFDFIDGVIASGANFDNPLNTVLPLVLLQRLDDAVIAECLGGPDAMLEIASLRDRLQPPKHVEVAINKLQGKLDAFTQARRKGSDVTHAETRAIKADVFVWLDSHAPEFTVIEAAARAIIKQQPITHGTARDWFKEWKKLRSASTP
jgi:hypothetical protein